MIIALVRSLNAALQFIAIEYETIIGAVKRHKLHGMSAGDDSVRGI